MEHVFGLTSRSVAIVWGGEHVLEFFLKRFFLVFLSGRARRRCNFLYRIRCVFYLWHGRIREQYVSLGINLVKFVNWVFNVL